MKKLKDPMVPIAGRVSPQLKAILEKEAESLEISLSECVGMHVMIGYNSSDGTKALKLRLQDANDSLDILKRENGYLKRSSPWSKEPYVNLLQSVLRNDQVLERFYKVHGKKLINMEELIAAGLKIHSLLRAHQIGDLSFYFSGNFGWSYSDQTRKFVYIRKRNW